MGGILNIILRRGDWISIVSCIISSAIIVFLILPVHEFAHGFAATKLGDPTPKWQGRMKLNPMAHLDYVGALMIFLIGFGWAKPVQVDMRYFKNPKRDMAIVAFAGPLSNLICAFLAILIENLVVFIYWSWLPAGFGLTVLMILEYIFYFIGVINISLAVFNLIPLPPLDGSKILAAFLPDRTYYRLMQYERYFMLILMVLLFAGSGLSNVISRFVSGIYDGFRYITWLPFDLILN